MQFSHEVQEKENYEANGQSKINCEEIVKLNKIIIDNKKQFEIEINSFKDAMENERKKIVNNEEN